MTLWTLLLALFLGPTTNAGNHFDPNGATTDAGGHFDPDG
jgi:hypothetical protein